MRALEYLRVDLVLDVGANAGQYSQSLREHGDKGRIVSFDPLSITHAILANAAVGDARWEIAPRTAVGSECGTAMLPRPS